MVDILHRVGVKGTTPEAVYGALTTVEGLAGWWTEDTKGGADVGGVLEFRFSAGGFDMEVVELRPCERVLWRVVDGPEEWVGTTVEWDLRQDGEYTIVLFKHRGLSCNRTENGVSGSVRAELSPFIVPMQVATVQHSERSARPSAGGRAVTWLSKLSGAANSDELERWV